MDGYVIPNYSQLRSLTTCNLVSYCALVYDFLLTYSSEIEHIWPTPWSIGKVLYFLTRYPALIDGVIAIYTHNGPPSLSPSACRTLLRYSSWFFFLGVIIAEFIIGFRTWAIWGRSKRIGLACALLALSLIIPASFVVRHTLNVENSLLPNMASLTCVFSKKPTKMLYIDFSFIIIFESLTLVLTLCKAWPYLRYTPSKFIITLYRDGIVFYLYLTAFSTINIITIARYPNSAPMFLLMQRDLHSILTSRLLLNLHEAVSKDRAPLDIQQEYSVDTADGIALTTLVPGIETWFGQQQQP